MPFSFYNPTPLSAEQASPYANLVKNSLANYQNAVHARYLPQIIKSEMFGRQFGPLAQIASSPIASAMLPEQQKQMAALISQLLQQNGGTGGQGSSPSIMQSIFGGSPSPQQNGGGGMMPNPSSPPNMGNVGAGSPGMGNPNYNPAIPQAGRDIGTGAAAQALGGSQEQIHKGGTSFYDPATNKFYSQPTEGTVAVSQNAINAIKRITPQLEKIAEESQEFLAPSSNLKMLGSSIAGRAQRWGLMNPEFAKKFDVDKLSRYKKFTGDISSAMESLVNAYPNISQAEGSQNRLISILEPIEGENSTGYKKRVMQQIESLNTQTLPQLRGQLLPINISGNNESNNKPVSRQKSSSKRRYTDEEVAAEMKRRRLING